VVFGAGAIYTSQLATTANSGFSIWPTYVLGAVAAIGLYMCFATIWGWWPAGRSTRGQTADAVDRPETVYNQQSDKPRRTVTASGSGSVAVGGDLSGTVSTGNSNVGPPTVGGDISGNGLTASDGEDSRP
jgi:hypothetical protein